MLYSAERSNSNVQAERGLAVFVELNFHQVEASRTFPPKSSEGERCAKFPAPFLLFRQGNHLKAMPREGRYQMGLEAFDQPAPWAIRHRITAAGLMMSNSSLAFTGFLSRLATSSAASQSSGGRPCFLENRVAPALNTIEHNPLAREGGYLLAAARHPCSTDCRSRQGDVWPPYVAPFYRGDEMIFFEAQREMRRAYVGGGPGVLVSAIIWLAAALTQHGRGTAFAFAVLFFGGMLIFPLATLVSRAVFHREREAPGNPLGMAALESTIAMIGGLFAAWLFLDFKAAFVFPLAAIAVGTHYAVFRTVYGDNLFWALGAIITAIGLWEILIAAVPGGVTLWVAAVEIICGIILTLRAIREKRAHPEIFAA